MCCEYLDLKYQGGTRYLLKLWGGKASKVDIFEAEARNPTIRVTPDEREIVREVFLYLDEVSRYEYAFSVNLVRLEDIILDSFIGHGREELTHVMNRYRSEMEYAESNGNYDFNGYSVLVAGFQAILETNLLVVAC